MAVACPRPHVPAGGTAVPLAPPRCCYCFSAAAAALLPCAPAMDRARPHRHRSPSPRTCLARGRGHRICGPLPVRTQRRPRALLASPPLRGRAPSRFLACPRAPRTRLASKKGKKEKITPTRSPNPSSDPSPRHTLLPPISSPSPPPSRSTPLSPHPSHSSPPTASPLPFASVPQHAKRLVLDPKRRRLLPDPDPNTTRPLPPSDLDPPSPSPPPSTTLTVDEIAASPPPLSRVPPYTLGHRLALHSAAYGGYLTAMDEPAPLGHHGCRIEQRDYEKREEEDVRWKPVRLVHGNYILLRHTSGRFLRANGKYLPWNNGSSIDNFDTVSTMTHSVVERIPSREGMPETACPRPAPDHREEELAADQDGSRSSFI
ncbi:extensin-like [Triticum urartu]|uniref:extensin-like n=1 Tax=Triticum urartu TaxID=4572 RepID=UPI00204434B3|nr:extensin-like [Triticum urartu]